MEIDITVTLPKKEYDSLLEASSLSAYEIKQAFIKYAEDLEEENARLRLELEEAKIKKKTFMNIWDFKVIARIHHCMSSFFDIWSKYR